MNYHSLHETMKRLVNFDADAIDLGYGPIVRNFDLQSRIRHPLQLSAESDDVLAAAKGANESVLEDLRSVIRQKDMDIAENLRFRYHLLMPGKAEKTRKVIVLFHGFNEKQWIKYLPWASRLCERTGKAVLLFPIAFHMNRAPGRWTDIRAMNRVSKLRRTIHPSVIDSSLSNVAISIRLHYRPERFIWSGLESYYDVMDLVENIRRGGHTAIEADADIDFFSYSVGSFLGQTIMMTNRKGWFSTSKYAIFCGGPVFNRLSPVSKFILDSEASVRLYSYLVEHLESHMRDDPALRDVLDGDLPEGRNFRSLLNYRDNLAYREEKFREIAGRLHAVALAADEVVPPYEVVNTLRGSRHDIGIQVDIVDLPYPYRHEDPFPKSTRQREQVDKGFDDVFDRITGFLAD